MFQSMNKNKEKHLWPPEVLPCPDYWVHQGNGVCKNTFGLGLGQAGDFKSGPMDSYDFGKTPGCTKPNSSTCLEHKRNWANRTQNPWFGIANKCSQNPANCYIPA